VTAERNFRLTVAFDGTDYLGWQEQAAGTTVQGLLSEAVRTVTRERTKVIGSGRTDAGTHARALVANFHTRARIPPRGLLRALNALLPPTVRVLAVRSVSRDFHARRSAHSKVYRYQIYRGPILPPHLAREHYHYPHPLDVDAMRAAAALLVGTHDFRSLAKASSLPVVSNRSTVRTILRSEVREQGRRLLYTVEADGFLHHMVRNIVGTLLDTGRGRIPPSAIGEILLMRDRRRAGFTAPACGLVLLRVRYTSTPLRRGPRATTSLGSGTARGGPAGAPQPPVSSSGG